MTQNDKIQVCAPAGLPVSLIIGYLENCRNNLVALQAAYERKDYEFVRVFGHRMKGCGGGYGFTELSEAGAVIEAAAKARSDFELQRQISALEHYLARVEVIG